MRQRETIPDHVFDGASEVELIDLPAADLLARLKAGKVYVASQAGAAQDNFFRSANLNALRELALRRTADRVDAAARSQALPKDPNSRPWLSRDRLLVAIGPDAQAEQVVRAGKRMADALDAPWTAVYVETPDLLRLPERERNRRIDVLRLAESLGAETVTLDGPTAAERCSSTPRPAHAKRLVGTPKRRGLRAAAAALDDAGADAQRQRARRDHGRSPARGTPAAPPRLATRVTRSSARSAGTATAMRPLVVVALHGGRVRDVPVLRAGRTS